MPLSIRSPEVEYRARELARRTGSTMTEAIARALDASLDRIGGGSDARRARLAQIAAECAALPDLPDLGATDHRSADEILGYGPEGAFDHGR